MFDEHQVRKPSISVTPPVITIACAGGGMLLSFGLCGAASFMPAPHFPTFQSIGLILFGLSLLAIVVGIVWLILVVITNAFRS